MKNIFRTGFVLFSLLLISLALPVQPACADTQYVSDTLIVGLREGKGGEYRVIEYLKTGTPLEILEEDSPYLRVRTLEGEEGWVHKQYITSETPKAVIIEGLRKDITRLRAKVEGAEKNQGSLSDTLKTARKTHGAKVKELESAVKKHREETSRTARELKLTTEKYDTLLEQSKDVAEVVAERDRLKEENERTGLERERLLGENERLKDMKIVWWFLAGAGVLFVGWITGKVSRRKRYY